MYIYMYINKGEGKAFTVKGQLANTEGMMELGHHLWLLQTGGQMFDKEQNVYGFKISSPRLLINCKGAVVTLQRKKPRDIM